MLSYWLPVGITPLLEAGFVLWLLISKPTFIDDFYFEAKDDSLSTGSDKPG